MPLFLLIFRCSFLSPSPIQVWQILEELNRFGHDPETDKLVRWEATMRWTPDFGFLDVLHGLEGFVKLGETSNEIRVPVSGGLFCEYWVIGGYDLLAGHWIRKGYGRVSFPIDLDVQIWIAAGL
jgi:hypothetical protein